ncbi:6-hydroxymethylpterin diphosphokinase MptE-like protein [Pokkaliibacter sp. CJK22405]|uniref:motility associated factor glycosyltransferase family protein n=1 Tax=Pokkaliibacter sp. CJK22405 TaxID=3384615 RepID=UPI003984BBC3
MLRNISQQVLPNDAEQSELEEVLAGQLSERRNRSIQAILNYLPHLAPHINDVVRDDCLSIFCTRESQANLVDFATGRCWYTADPKSEVAEEIAAFQQCAYRIALNEEELPKGPDSIQQRGVPFISPQAWQMHRNAGRSLPEHVPLMLMFGMGLGYQLEVLSQQHDVDCWLIYEPLEDVFNASLYAFDWDVFLSRCVEQGKQVYLQIGNNAETLDADLLALKEAHGLEHAWVYRHYSHPQMDALYQYVVSAYYRWDDLMAGRIEVHPFGHLWDEVSPRAVPVEYLATADIAVDELQQRWQQAKMQYAQNMAVFSEYYPQIAEGFFQYRPQAWHLFLDDQLQWNLFHEGRGVSLYGRNPEGESDAHFEHFQNFPNKDDVLLNVTGGKLAHYGHFRFVRELRQLFTDKGAKTEKLPERVNCMVLFGMALGYQLRDLLEATQINHLYLCEPNHDFFYASLYVLDWREILERVDETKSSLFLNLGDDGSNLMSDLLSQFYRIGPYNIVNTYIYPVYHHPVMQQAAFDLRHEFKVVVSMGEYVDHVRYGLSHMKGCFERELVHMARADVAKTMADYNDYPVVIVGNGPSLDHCIDFLKANRDRFILISCGTALKPLYVSGITPDFHAEVEQNFNTYSWISSIKDPDWLKKITMLTISGVHPDTASLFGATAMAFKNGEASAHAYQQAPFFPEDEFLSVNHAYPTVSNAALSMALTMGFKNLYLMGVDLGYRQIGKHHSSLSDYYVKDAAGQTKETYDYVREHGLQTVRGNFADFVFTKHEFSVSAKSLSRALASFPTATCHNCSDGAAIDGAIPLPLSALELPEQDQKPSYIVQKLMSDAFADPAECARRAAPFADKFSEEQLAEDMASMLEWLDEQAPDSREALDKMIHEQRQRIEITYLNQNSLFYYLYWGSMSYVSSLLIKMANLSNDEEACMDVVREGLEIWKRYLRESFEDYRQDPDRVERTPAFNPNW